MTPSARRTRARVSAALFVVDVVAILLVAAGVHGPVRFVVGLTAALCVPGWAIVGPLRLGSAALEAALAVAVSLSALLVLAQLLITIHQWHLTATQLVVLVLSAPSLAWQALDGRRLTAESARVPQ